MTHAGSHDEPQTSSVETRKKANSALLAAVSILSVSLGVTAAQSATDVKTSAEANPARESNIPVVQARPSDGQTFSGPRPNLQRADSKFKDEQMLKSNKSNLQSNQYKASFAKRNDQKSKEVGTPRIDRGQMLKNNQLKTNVELNPQPLPPKVNNNSSGKRP